MKSEPFTGELFVGTQDTALAGRTHSPPSASLLKAHTDAGSSDLPGRLPSGLMSLHRLRPFDHSLGPMGTVLSSVRRRGPFLEQPQVCRRSKVNVLICIALGFRDCNTEQPPFCRDREQINEERWGQRCSQRKQSIRETVAESPCFAETLVGAGTGASPLLQCVKAQDVPQDAT